MVILSVGSGDAYSGPPTIENRRRRIPSREGGEALQVVMKLSMSLSVRGRARDGRRRVHVR